MHGCMLVSTRLPTFWLIEVSAMKSRAVHSAEWEEGAAGVEVTWTSRDLWGPPGPGKGKSLGSYSGYNVKTLEGFKQEVL